MKPQDLMIGDWVIRKGVPNDPMRLYNMNASRGIAYLDQDGRGVAELFKNLEPIPLTPEILEKNDFMKDDFLDYEESRIGISLLYKERSNGEEGFRVLIENRSPKNETRTTIKPAKYVHEIQHSFKELDIEKDIVI